MKLPRIFRRSNKPKTPGASNTDSRSATDDARVIRDTLAEFDIEAKVLEANVGHGVTSFLVQLAPGVNPDKIAKLDANLALNLQATTLRVVSSLTDSSQVGIEVPNAKLVVARLSDLFDQLARAKKAMSKLEFIVGKDISGRIVTADLASLPHLMIAGQTGSGKSTMLRNILANILPKNSPEDLQVILIDPKQAEFTPYEHIPHLQRPVITEPSDWSDALSWVLQESERRLQLLASSAATDIDEYRVKTDEHLPHILIMSDEFSDMMMQGGDEVERIITSVAGSAAKTGIHFVVSTSRPSVNVYTDTLKACFEPRMVFTVASRVDSESMLGESGAEKLNGRGDLLYRVFSETQADRIQAAYVSDDEMQRLTKTLRDN